MKVIVVGAGISGLAAAWALQGHDVQVFEAGARAGGRMQTAVIGGCPMELGAQFLSSRYAVVPRLAREVGLEPTTVASATAVRVDGVLRRFSGSSPLSQFTGGLLPWRSAPRAGVGLLRMLASASGRSLVDLTAWLDEDQRPGAAWASSVMGDAVAERALAPTLNGFYFQHLDESSGALPGAVTAFGLRPGTTTTIPGGLGRVTEALAARIPVTVNAHVEAVERGANSATVVVDGVRHTADAVVLALPGEAAGRVLTDATEPERALMGTPYSAGLVVGVPLPRRLRPHELAGAYGVLVHPGEGTRLASVAVASRAHPDLGDRDLLTVMFSDSAAREASTLDDRAVTELAVRGLLQLDPALDDVLPRGHCSALMVRHPQAMPTCPVGHAAAVAAYRETAARSRVVLAGDYLGFPWTDSAAATGEWAAGVVVGADSSG